MTAQRGEIWLVDLGLAAKVRPALVISVPFHDDERALLSIIPHTTSLRSTRFEISLEVRGLQAGAFDVQGIRPIPPTVFIRRLGSLSPEQVNRIEDGIRRWFGMP
jgi:mRNA interferase MazF